VPDRASLEDRLSEAQRWCIARARSSDPAGSLRTTDLRPRVLQASYAEAITSVCLTRARALVALGGNHVGATAEGRLLAYFPDADLADGAAEVASRGFFDLHNCPPWDTWVALRSAPALHASRRSVVLAWVPAVLLPDAERGVHVNPEECIEWLTPSLAERLGLGHLAR
jgi:hypothetical protein